MTAVAARAPEAPRYVPPAPSRRAVPAVRIDDLSKSFRVPRPWRELARRPFAPPAIVPSLQRINLEIAPGEFFGVLGPNGAGKTTLFRILATYMLPDTGSASVFGRDVVRDGAAVRRLNAENYELQVSSPGERALRTPGDWRRFVGRWASILAPDLGGRFEAQIKEVGEDDVLVVLDDRKKSERRIPLAAVKEARLAFRL